DDGVPDDQDLLPVSWRNFSSIHGLADNTVWSLTQSGDGEIWALTARGLQRLTFNSAYTVITPFFFTYFAGVPFGEGSKIKADGRNNVWVSSITGGLYVLLSNATPWPDWSGFRKENSMLLSDEVTAVAIDDRKGLAYIATSKGINALKIPFAKAKKSYSSLKAFPSPYRIPAAEPMVLDGLKDESSLKIMTLSGEVIRQIDTTSPSVQGYQAFWDGKTDGGNWVSTGVYLVAAYSKDGDSRVTKVAVIRE
ncbi:MAG TPA: FlgD immunoglobulin-like domain containing protein, partial [Candidatus Marinimicrobia bacterium]|nr:FlgD immunoglobulin-like domain containing protein [Candidatus Neomarinimicrobiota bacterium]